MKPIEKKVILSQVKRPYLVLNWIQRYVQTLAVTMLVFVLWVQPSTAGPLSDRIATFPEWQSPPPGSVTKGELLYPDWFEGTWQATSILEEAIAPLAPDLVTPGFERNQRLLHEPVEFTVRFVPAQAIKLLARRGLAGFPHLMPTGITSDRVFNSLNLAEATLGAGAVQSVVIDPANNNRLTTQFRAGSQMISESRERAVEEESGRFISSELFLQTYRTPAQIYLNQVENTTDYRLIENARPRIEANQITAIYLSPKDPDYFQARNRPVALYRYQLILEKST